MCGNVDVRAELQSFRVASRGYPCFASPFDAGDHAFGVRTDRKREHVRVPTGNFHYLRARCCDIDRNLGLGRAWGCLLCEPAYRRRISVVCHLVATKITL